MTTSPIPEPSDPRIGQCIAGRYELTERLGVGGAATVYRAVQAPLGRPVAVKLLTSTPTRPRRQLRRFVNEARILSRLQHPNTIRLLDFGRTDDGRPFMVMDVVDGGTLRDLLDGRRLDPVVALRLTRQLASALAEAHAKGIIHRDVKPENVLVECLPDDDWVARLTDFGLSKDTSEDADIDLTGPRTRVGTAAYMSPEQAFCGPVDPTTDLYALGGILFEMLTGHRVFAANKRQTLYFDHAFSTPPRLTDVAPDLDIPPGLEALVGQLLAKQTADRPSSAGEVVRHIDALLTRLEPSGQLTSPALPRPEPALPDPPRVGRFELPLSAWVTGMAGGLVGVVALLVSLV